MKQEKPKTWNDIRKLADELIKEMRLANRDLKKVIKIKQNEKNGK